jgi:hypothetical protein
MHFHLPVAEMSANVLTFLVMGDAGAALAVGVRLACQLTAPSPGFDSIDAAVGEA